MLLVAAGLLFALFCGLCVSRVIVIFSHEYHEISSISANDTFRTINILDESFVPTKNYV